MAAPVSMRLRVTVVTGHGDVQILVLAQSTDRIAGLVERLVRECGLTGDTSAWQLVFTDRTLPPTRTLREVVPSALDPVPLTLRAASAAPVPSPPGPVPGPTGGSARLSVSPTASRGEEQGTVTTQELDAIVTPTDRMRSAERSPHTRRASVSYYSRMNPERVYPLVVVLSREEIEIALQRHIQQRTTRPTRLSVDAPIEIEPVLPGCAVHPPRLVTCLGPEEEAFEFHVVPHVLGPVTGARVRILQEHATLAEVELKAHVVQRTMVLVVGMLAFFLPILSAVLTELNVDFTPKEPSNVYLWLLTFFFGELSPVLLTLLLAGLAGILFWFTRPLAREIRWDLTRPPVPKARS